MVLELVVQGIFGIADGLFYIKTPGIPVQVGNDTGLQLRHYPPVEIVALVLLVVDAARFFFAFGFDDVIRATEVIGFHAGHRVDECSYYVCLFHE